MKKPRKQMTFEIDRKQHHMLEVISRHTGIPVEVLLVQSLVSYCEYRLPDIELPWPRKSEDSENE
jgi:hypothetical protein